MASQPPIVIRTLSDLSTALNGEIAGGFAIIDRTLFDGVRPPYRTIEMHHDGWGGPLLGSFAEYPTTDQPLRFVPAGSIEYRTLEPIVAALRSHGVVIEEPI